jgi:hypothetical protein
MWRMNSGPATILKAAEIVSLDSLIASRPAPPRLGAETYRGRQMYPDSNDRANSFVLQERRGGKAKSIEPTG